jgi:hypothetical protein
MPNKGLIDLRAMADARASDVEHLVAGIEGARGQAPWTVRLRAAIRKDDPPEED